MRTENWEKLADSGKLRPQLDTSTTAVSGATRPAHSCGVDPIKIAIAQADGAGTLEDAGTQRFAVPAEVYHSQDNGPSLSWLAIADEDTHHRF